MPVIDIGKYKARVNFEDRAKNGSITIESGSMSIEISGHRVTKDEVMQLLQSVDIDGIAALK